MCVFLFPWQFFLARRLLLFSFLSPGMAVLISGTHHPLIRICLIALTSFLATAHPFAQMQRFSLYNVQVSPLSSGTFQSESFVSLPSLMCYSVRKRHFFLPGNIDLCSRQALLCPTPRPPSPYPSSVSHSARALFPPLLPHTRRSSTRELFPPPPLFRHPSAHERFSPLLPHS